MSTYKFIDIAVNLTDPVFQGIYREKRKHQDDFDAVLDRAKRAGVVSQMITGGSLAESKEALKLAKSYGLFSTAGCHPTRSSEFDAHPNGHSGYLEELDSFISSSLQSERSFVAAIGECGLDYDRIHFAAPEVQMKAFRSQLQLAKKHHLPLFLHSRNAAKDFVTILREEGFGEDGGRASGGRGGVVHSFTGTSLEAEEIISMGFHIGWNSNELTAVLANNNLSVFSRLNGCSLKTEDNLVTAKSIPLDRLMLETDAPWCSMTSTQASRKHIDLLPSELKTLYFPTSTKPESFVSGKAVKGRNEPCTIGGVAFVIAQLHGLPLETVATQAYQNTVTIFGLHEM